MDLKTKLKNDWKIILLLFIIVLLGIVVRLVDYSEIGYWTDDMTTLPTALIWFYPHTEYPGFSGHGEPALGHWFIGAGCMLSGEDFSAATQVHPNFFPGRGELIGKQLVKAEKFCFAPVHIFGILFLIIIALLSYSALGGWGAVYSTAFFAFYSIALVYSRWTKVDIILCTFIALGLLFLWLGYEAEKGTKREIMYFSCASSIMALALAVKFSAALFVAFTFFLILEKYFATILSLLKGPLTALNLKLAEKITSTKLEYSLIKNIIFSAVSFSFFYLLPFSFKPSVIIRLFKEYRTLYPEFSTMGFYPLNALKIAHAILAQVNIFDTVVFLFAIFIFIKILIKKGKSNLERFVLYLSFVYLFALLTTKTLSMARINLPYLIGFALLAGLAFSEKGYSALNSLKIKNKKPFFIIFIVIYTLFSFGYALSTSPYYATQNHLLCLFEKEKCEVETTGRLMGLSVKQITNFLQDKLGENETVLLPGGIYYFYLRPEEEVLHYQFILPFRQQTGKNPSIADTVKYFHPLGRQIRYVLIANLKGSDEEELIKNTYNPTWTFRAKGRDIMFIYDLYNLTKKQS